MNSKNDYKKRSVILGFLLMLMILPVAVCTCLCCLLFRDLPIIEAVEDIRYNYYYYNDQGTIGEQFTDALIKAVTESIGDPYAQYYSAEEYEELNRMQSGKYIGIGILLREPDESGAVIEQVYSQSAMEKAGGKTGDRIISIDGRSIAGLTLDQMVALFDFGTKRDYVLELLRDGNIIPVEVEGSEVYVPYTSVRILPEQIGYIRIMQFHGKVVDEVSNALASFADSNVKGVVLDLRNNPGGDFDKVKSIAEMFLKKGDLIVSLKKRNGESKNYYSISSDGTELPLAVIVNRGSASASELLAGALKDNGRAKVVGTTTYGKGIVQSLYKMFSNGGVIKFTTEAYFTPSGICIHGTGIVPDIIVDETDEKEDAPLDAAVDCIEKQTKD